MGVFQSWRAYCDSCNAPEGAAITQRILLDSLKKAGWTFRREPAKSGYTQLVATCPKCKDAERSK